jgi:hypothetical protein
MEVRPALAEFETLEKPLDPRPSLVKAFNIGGYDHAEASWVKSSPQIRIAPLAPVQNQMTATAELSAALPQMRGECRQLCKN